MSKMTVPLTIVPRRRLVIMRRGEVSDSGVRVMAFPPSRRPAPLHEWMCLVWGSRVEGSKAGSGRPLDLAQVRMADTWAHTEGQVVRMCPLRGERLMEKCNVVESDPVERWDGGVQALVIGLAEPVAGEEREELVHAGDARATD